jgi:hypothetical protein
MIELQQQRAGVESGWRRRRRRRRRRGSISSSMGDSDRMISWVRLQKSTMIPTRSG